MLLCWCSASVLGLGLCCATNVAVQLDVLEPQGHCALQDRKLHGIFRSVSDGALNINSRGVCSPDPARCASQPSLWALMNSRSVAFTAEQGAERGKVPQNFVELDLPDLISSPQSFRYHDIHPECVPPIQDSCV